MTSVLSDRQLVRMVVNYHTASSRQLTALCSTATGVLISASPIRRRLLYRGLRANSFTQDPPSGKPSMVAFAMGL
ncbi:hypothetical protein TNCV_3692261 [Trichonephila clavipes]|nr:hypothetical protein TNCV_3692261 [Trichonephila clavipes]